MAEFPMILGKILFYLDIMVFLKVRPLQNLSFSSSFRKNPLQILIPVANLGLSFLIGF